MLTQDSNRSEKVSSSPGGRACERIIYVAPDFTDSAVKKRAHAFLAFGHELLSFSFRRDRYNVGIEADWPNVELGKSTERRLAARIWMCFTSLWTIHSYRRNWRDSTMIYARNLDLAILALIGRLITWSRAPLVYEVLDIHPILTQQSVRGAIMRWVERRVLNRCRILIVSSPAYVSEYFQARQHYHGETFLLENKWPRENVFSHRTALDFPLAMALDGPHPVWTIGWFGNLRCRESLRILTAVAEALPDRVRIYMRGCDSLLGDGVMSRTTDEHPNMVFAGEYNAPDQLPEIYSHVHFNWCPDFSDGDNSRWLIPNRVYEGGYFGVPALAVDGYETGRVVSERELGISLEAPYIDHLTTMLCKMSRDDYSRLRTHIDELPESLFVDLGDTARLIRRLIT